MPVSIMLRYANIPSDNPLICHTAFPYRFSGKIKEYKFFHLFSGKELINKEMIAILYFDTTIHH